MAEAFRDSNHRTLLKGDFADKEAAQAWIEANGNDPDAEISNFAVEASLGTAFGWKGTFGYSVWCKPPRLRKK